MGERRDRDRVNHTYTQTLSLNPPPYPSNHPPTPTKSPSPHPHPHTPTHTPPPPQAASSPPYSAVWAAGGPRKQGQTPLPPSPAGGGGWRCGATMRGCCGECVCHGMSRGVGGVRLTTTRTTIRGFWAVGVLCIQEREEGKGGYGRLVTD
jgi:hypothetical protein